MDNYEPNQACYCMRCRSRGLMGPAVLVTLGVLFLLSEFGVAHFERTWPILLIVIGLVKVLAGNLDTTGHVEAAPPPPGPTPVQGPGYFTPPPPGAPPAPSQNPQSPEVDHV
jgi:cell wall-active antibiotic response 4TMS protein YvqF